MRITYDAIGNPLSYNGWTYSWKAGRMLHSMAGNGVNAQFTYDHTGLRVKKTVNGMDTLYTLNGKKITHIRKGDVQMHFFYDAQGRPSMIRYNGNDYTYMHNLQGDIVSIVDAEGRSVVEYSYDAWGRPVYSNLGKTCMGSMADTLGVDNPFRYRGYVYDEETGLYVTATRYYNPEWGRFINGDTLLGQTGALLSQNIFTYCINDPVNMSDSTGLSPVSIYTIYSINEVLGEKWIDKEKKERRMGGGILIDLETMEAFKVGWGDVRDDGYHLDVSPKTPADSTIVRGIAKDGGFSLTGGKAWNAREGILISYGMVIPVGFNLCGHGGSSMEGTDPDFKRHFCVYPYDAWGNKPKSTDPKLKYTTLAYQNAAKRANTKITGGFLTLVGLALGIFSSLRK